MMYTPTPAARRPRPPASMAKSRLSSSTSSASTSRDSADGNAQTRRQTVALASISAHRVVPTSAPGGYQQQRRDNARSDMLEDSASPSNDLGEISLTLDTMSPDLPAVSLPSMSSTGIGLGLPSSIILSHPLSTSDAVQPSPPPPYGRELPNPSVPTATTLGNSTPPSQDSGHPSRRTSSVPSDGEHAGVGESGKGDMDAEERLRARRATDAARAIGLDMDFGTVSAGEDDSELEEDEEELRKRLRSVRRRLRQRDKELLMAAQVADQALRQHEQVLSQLSPTMKNRLPQLLSLLAVAPASSRSQPSSRASSRAASRASRIISPPSSSFRQSQSMSITSIASVLSPPLPDQRQHRRTPSADSSGFGGDPSPDRLRTIRLQTRSAFQRKVSRPRAFQHQPAGNGVSPKERERYMYQQLQVEEAELRIHALEMALCEAQAGEENQRKAAARLRRDHEKLKRDLERAEKGPTSEVYGLGLVGRKQSARPTPISTPVRDSQRADVKYRVHLGAEEDEIDEVEEIMEELKDEEEDWPQSSPRQSGLKATYWQRPSTSDSMRRPPLSRHRSSPAASGRMRSGSANSSTLSGFDQALSSEFKRGSPNEARTTPQTDARRARRPITGSSFFPPGKRSPYAGTSARLTSTPSVNIFSPTAGLGVGQSAVDLNPEAECPPTGPRPRPPSRHSSTRAPTPEPQPASPDMDSFASPVPSIGSVAAALMLSPRFASLSTRMALMRDFVADSMSIGPSATGVRTKTLGSELGSEYGDHWFGSSRAHSRQTSVDPPDQTDTGEVDTSLGGTHADADTSPRVTVTQDPGTPSDSPHDTDWVDEPDSYGDSGSDQTTPFTSPAPLPPAISAALSSLASALAPHGWEVGSSPDKETIDVMRMIAALSPALSSNVGTKLGVERRPTRDQFLDVGGSARRKQRRLSSPSPMSSQKRAVGQGPPPQSLVAVVPPASSSEGERDAQARLLHSQPATPRNRKRKGKARENAGCGSVKRQPPPLHRAGSSQSSVALAHRRTLLSAADQRAPDIDEGTPQVRSIALPDTNACEMLVCRGEPATVPGRIIHDLMVWSIILLEWVEMAIIMGIRVGMDVRYGTAGIMRRTFREQARRRRYYL